jgi:hypothetical protein
MIIRTILETEKTVDGITVYLKVKQVEPNTVIHASNLVLNFHRDFGTNGEVSPHEDIYFTHKVVLKHDWQSLVQVEEHPLGWNITIFVVDKHGLLPAIWWLGDTYPDIALDLEDILKRASQNMDKVL